jgi:hypothetical protein
MFWMKESEVDVGFEKVKKWFWSSIFAQEDACVPDKRHCAIQQLLFLIGLCIKENYWFRWFTILPLFMVLVFMFMGEAWNPEKVMLSWM